MLNLNIKISPRILSVNREVRKHTTKIEGFYLYNNIITINTFFNKNDHRFRTVMEANSGYQADIKKTVM